MFTFDIIFDKKEETDQTLLHVYFFKLCFLLICTVFYSSPHHHDLDSENPKKHIF